MPWPQHLQKPHWGHDGLKCSHRAMWESHAGDVMFPWGLLSHCPPSSQGRHLLSGGFAWGRLVHGDVQFEG